MAEIEHFVDPEGGKKHPRFQEVQDIELSLLDRNVQLAGNAQVQRMTIGKAVSTGLVDNETPGYFLARIQLFLLKLGVDESKIRFRQHMPTVLTIHRQALANDTLGMGGRAWHSTRHFSRFPVHQG
jgi:glycyl-tRNA synthetase